MATPEPRRGTRRTISIADDVNLLSPQTRSSLRLPLGPLTASDIGGLEGEGGSTSCIMEFTLFWAHLTIQIYSLVLTGLTKWATFFKFNQWVLELLSDCFFKIYHYIT